MAQSGYTPISLYFSSVTGNVPTAGQVVNGELAINIRDGKLYFKNAAGVVTLLASTASLFTVPVTVDQGGTGLTSIAAGLIPYGDSSTALSTSSSLEFDGTTLIVGPGSVLGGATNPFLAVTGNSNGYIQQYIYNASSGTSASSDFAAYPDNGLDSSGWIDMGITSSTYSDVAFPITAANEGYILMSAPAGAGKSGNLVYATDSTGSTNYHQWYVGGFSQAKSAWKMQLTSTGLQLANALAGTYGGTGVNNGSKTITLGGNLTTSGAFNLTFTLSNTTSLTLPTSGVVLSSVTAPAANPITGTPSASTYLRGDGTWATFTTGTVTTVSVASANGFAGTVANATTTPAITISTSITGLLQGNGTALSAVTIGTGISFSGGTLSNSSPMVYPGAGIAVSTGSAWTTSLSVPSGALVGTSDSQTLTNKRITLRIGTTASAATITPTSDLSDQYNVTALATGATFAIPSGTPTDGQKLTIRIKDNGGAQTLAWTTSAGGYRVIGTTLPTTTVAGKVLYVGCIYNSQDGFWDVTAVAQQA